MEEMLRQYPAELAACIKAEEATQNVWRKLDCAFDALRFLTEMPPAERPPSYSLMLHYRKTRFRALSFETACDSVKQGAPTLRFEDAGGDLWSTPEEFMRDAPWLFPTAVERDRRAAEAAAEAAKMAQGLEASHVLETQAARGVEAQAARIALSLGTKSCKGTQTDRYMGTMASVATQTELHGDPSGSYRDARSLRDMLGAAKIDNDDQLPIEERDVAPSRMLHSGFVIPHRREGVEDRRNSAQPRQVDRQTQPPPRKKFRVPTARGGQERMMDKCKDVSNEAEKKASSELPERLKHCDPDLVKRIEHEIMEQGQPITFEDVAGLDTAKAAIREMVIWPMKRPEIFTGLRSVPKGMLLFGPPGTGAELH